MKTLLYRVSCLFFILITVNGCKDKIPNAVPIEFSEISGTDITEFTVTLASAITKSGSQEISDHGFAFSATTETPDINSASIKKGAVDITTPTPIGFTGILSGLEPDTEYYIRPYAISAQTTHFGKVLKIKTLNITQPAIKTDGSEAVTHNSAKLKGSISAKGTHPVSEYGLVWAVSANPTTSVTTKYTVKSNVTSFPASFNTTAANLASNTTYNFRAYVISNGVTSYGANMTVKTNPINQPAIATGNADNITVSSARLGGAISTAGTLAITERGIVWGTSANPTTASSKAAISGNVTTFPHNYTVNASGLNMNTTYNYRAYVISNGVTTYGENKTFKTSDQVQPGVRTDESKPASSEAYVVGTLTAAGSHPITEYGLCWGSSVNPVTSGSKQAYTGNVTSFPKQFDATIRNLNAGTTYHYRAYVIMNGVTTYGENKSFTTGVVSPSLTTRAATSISTVSATINGTVNSQGSFPLSEIGIVWGTSNNPTIANNKQSKSASGVGYPHNYSFNLTGLTQNTTYYFRAYAMVNGEVVYGGTMSFRTLTFRAVTVTTSGTRTNVSGQGYRVHGTVSSGTYRIVRYGFYHNDIPGSGFDFLQSKEISIRPGTPQTGTLNFNMIIPFYGCGRTVKYRAYAVDEGGNWIYGNVVQFNTGGCIN